MPKCQGVGKKNIPCGQRAIKGYCYCRYHLDGYQPKHRTSTPVPVQAIRERVEDRFFTLTDQEVDTKRKQSITDSKNQSPEELIEELMLQIRCLQS